MVGRRRPEHHVLKDTPHGRRIETWTPEIPGLSNDLRRCQSPGHNGFVSHRRLIAVRLLILAILLAAPGFALDDVYKWTDEQGRTHYSNRGGKQADEDDQALPPSNGEEGWESVLERKKGADDIATAAETQINSLQLKLIRRKRERDRMRGDLQNVQADIGRAQSTNAAALPELRSREQSLLFDLRKAEVEIAEIDTQIAKLKVLKAAGPELQKSAPAPFGQ